MEYNYPTNPPAGDAPGFGEFLQEPRTGVPHQMTAAMQELLLNPDPRMPEAQVDQLLVAIDLLMTSNVSISTLLNYPPNQVDPRDFERAAVNEMTPTERKLWSLFRSGARLPPINMLEDVKGLPTTAFNMEKLKDQLEGLQGVYSQPALTLEHAHHWRVKWPKMVPLLYAQNRVSRIGRGQQIAGSDMTIEQAREYRCRNRLLSAWGSFMSQRNERISRINARVQAAIGQLALDVQRLRTLIPGARQRVNPDEGLPEGFANTRFLPAPVITGVGGGGRVDRGTLVGTEAGRRTEAMDVDVTNIHLTSRAMGSHASDPEALAQRERMDSTYRELNLQQLGIDTRGMAPPPVPTFEIDTRGGDVEFGTTGGRPEPLITSHTGATATQDTGTTRDMMSDPRVLAAIAQEVARITQAQATAAREQEQVTTTATTQAQVHQEEEREEGEFHEGATGEAGDRGEGSSTNEPRGTKRSAEEDLEREQENVRTTRQAAAKSKPKV